MKQFMMLCLCMAIAASSVGCCWWQPYGGGCGSCGGGACGGPSYYGGGYPAGAYYGGTNATAGLPAATSPYAYGPSYPVTAGLPINSLPTY